MLRAPPGAGDPNARGPTSVSHPPLPGYLGHERPRQHPEPLRLLGFRVRGVEYPLSRQLFAPGNASSQSISGTIIEC
eukprot:3499490-Rhodomonas_salina.2